MRMIKIGAFIITISWGPTMCQVLCWALGPSIESDIDLVCKGLIIQWTQICNPKKDVSLPRLSTPKPSTGFPLGTGHRATLTMPRGIRQLPILKLRVSRGDEHVNSEPVLWCGGLNPVIQVCPLQGESYHLSHWLCARPWRGPSCTLCHFSPTTTSWSEPACVCHSYRFYHPHLTLALIYLIFFLNQLTWLDQPLF